MSVLSLSVSSGCKQPTDALLGTMTGAGTNPGGSSLPVGSQGGAQDQTGPAPGPGGDPELGCNDGERRRCSETSDGVSIIFPTPEPQGSCKRGVSTCQGDAWGPCVGAVGPKDQDSCERGNDDNCNGRPNDHCRCTAGEQQPCGSDEGACQQGVMTCGPDGSWGECEGAVEPTAELCDGKNIDEDCNGTADLADPACGCLDGQIERCELPGQGDCTLGVKQCNDGVFSACTPRFPGTEEVCGRQDDGREAILGRATGDEDCDGKVDETDANTPKPAGCENWMQDEDYDGYGAIGENVATGLDGATWGCLCSGQEPEGWARAEDDKQNRDCGDCKEAGAGVHPGVTAFTDFASPCLIEINYPLTFDYNCDGKNELEFTEQFSCELDSSGNDCKASGSWEKETPPGCGESQHFFQGQQECNFLGGSCIRTQALPPPRVQRCR